MSLAILPLCHDMCVVRSVAFVRLFFCNPRLPLEGGDCRRRAAMPVTLGEHAGAAASCPDASSFGTDTGRGGPTTKKTPALN